MWDLIDKEALEVRAEFHDRIARAKTHKESYDYILKKGPACAQGDRMREEKSLTVLRQPID